MRLVLDVHHSPQVARRLRDQGYDVIAAADDTTLRVIGDDELLEWSALEGRALVTENVKDFDRLARDWSGAGRHHGGFLVTSPRRFHRGNSAYPESLVKALAGFLATAPDRFTDQVHWL